jgi:cell division protein FtsL
MSANWETPQPNDPVQNRRMSDFTTAVELKVINTTLAEIKEDIKKVEKHDREILDLQYQFSAQQKSIEALTKSINELTSTMSNVTKQLGDQVAALSLKFFTGVAWLGGGTAVIAILWTLISSGLLHFGAGK